MSDLAYPSSYPSVSDSLPDVRREDKYEDSDSKAGTLSGPIDSLSHAHSSSLLRTPNTLTESTDWGNISTWTPGAISPSFQEVLEGTEVFHAVSAAYSAHPVGLILLYCLLVFNATPWNSRFNQMVNAGVDSCLFDLLEEMEGQSVPRMTQINRSPLSRPSSTFGPYHSVPGHAVPFIIDHHDHASFGLPLSNPLGSVSPHGRVSEDSFYSRSG